MAGDPYGRAIYDHHRGQRNAPLFAQDGEEVLEHPIEDFYFADPSEEDDFRWLESWLSGPLLDVGAGAGRHTRYFQERFETVAIDVSDHLVTTMDERGIADARRVDMFDLREAFDRGRFRSVLVHGTQLGLVGSRAGLRRVLCDLAAVTMSEATAVVDFYDPTRDDTRELLGYRDDPTPGLAYRVFHFEYEGDISETLLFRLFSPDRLREATVGAGWEVAEIGRGSGEDDHYYRAALTKR